MKKKRFRALALFSGGLDSLLAVKLILEQGVEVKGVKFISPFLTGSDSDYDVLRASRQLGISLKVVELDKDYLEMIRNPRYGYGKNMNPCLDCRIFILKKAKQIAKEIGADFIFTGEVLGERPMSQHQRAFKIIEKESALEGKILRPLSAKLLAETEAERKGLVEREKLLEIKGRSRKPQIELAEKYHLKYPNPGGGCLLTYRGFADKVRDLFEHQNEVSKEDIELLKIGRHFRYQDGKIIVGRDEQENERLLRRGKKEDYFFEVEDIVGPTTLLRGEKSEKTIKIAAQLTVHYSDAPGDLQVKVRYGKLGKMNKTLQVKGINDSRLEEIRIKGKS